ncbi:hypothetical protein K439DRAFT_1612485 [Ramaria rubella]|nr:hypothetical protein K439DRAFT_1612485 [Ramaria rubella]
MYTGQKAFDPQTANGRYELLPSDSTWLYRKFSNQHSIDILKPPQYNIDNWLNPTSPTYKTELAATIFHYQAQIEQDDRLQICIQTAEMKNAAWKYVHHKQVILDGTFGICDRRVLLFIALGVDEYHKGIPLAFFLFSAPTGNKATQAGYDTSILYHLLKSWRNSLGSQDGILFEPHVAITDTDTKERGALCWTNRHKKALQTGQTFNFPKQQVLARLRALEDQLLLSVKYEAAQRIIAQETQALNILR